MPNSVSAESFVTAIPSNLLPDKVIIISENNDRLYRAEKC